MRTAPVLPGGRGRHVQHIRVCRADPDPDVRASFIGKLMRHAKPDHQRAEPELSAARNHVAH